MREHATHAYTSKIIREGMRIMATKISSRRQELLDRVRCALVGSDGWCAVPDADAGGLTVRWSQEMATPDYARLPYQGTSGTAPALYPWPEYQRHVFVTLVGGPGHFSVLLRVNRCPWLQPIDREVPMFHALNVLDRPESAFAQVD